MSLRCSTLSLTVGSMLSAAANAAVNVPPPSNPPFVADRPSTATGTALPDPASRARHGIDVDVMAPTTGSPATAGAQLQIPLPQRFADDAAAFRALADANLGAAVQARIAAEIAERERQAYGGARLAPPAFGLHVAPLGWNWGLSWNWGYGSALWGWWPGFSLNYHWHRGRK